MFNDLTTFSGSHGEPRKHTKFMNGLFKFRTLFHPTITLPPGSIHGPIVSAPLGFGWVVGVDFVTGLGVGPGIVVLGVQEGWELLLDLGDACVERVLGVGEGLSLSLQIWWVVDEWWFQRVFVRVLNLLKRMLRNCAVMRLITSFLLKWKVLLTSPVG